MTARVAWLSFVLLLVLAAFSLRADPAPAEHPDDLVVIVNLGAEVQGVTRAEISSIFLKKRAQWEDGHKVTPIHAPSSSALRKVFQERVLLMTPRQEALYWQHARIRTGLRPPAEIATPVRAVFGVRSGVSYVFRKDLDERLAKVVLVFPQEAP